jgi:hypothetical protein
VKREFDNGYWVGRLAGCLEWVLEDLAAHGYQVPACGPAAQTLEEYRVARGSYLAELEEAKT